MGSRNTGKTATRPLTRDEWERMPWHARQRYVKQQERLARAIVQPLPVKAAPSFVRGNPKRCGQCGAWMLEKCWTGCDS